MMAYQIQKVNQVPMTWPKKLRADERQNMENYELNIYEREEEIGGTWWLNRYPGCVAPRMSTLSNETMTYG